jgi:translation initiation factor 3 subunit E
VISYLSSTITLNDTPSNDQESGKYASTFSEHQPLTAAWLADNLGVTAEGLRAYYDCAKFEYECGQYEVAAPMLTNFLRIDDHKQPSSELGFKALWGNFAALILLVSVENLDANVCTESVTRRLLCHLQPPETYPHKWDLAMAEFEKLKAAIDARQGSLTPGSEGDKQQLQQRTWLLHWSLFVFWNHPKGRDLIIDAFLSEKYLQVMNGLRLWIEMIA